MIKEFEKFHTKAYWDIKGYSIGYGTKAEKASDTITREQAEVALKASVRGCERQVREAVVVPLNQRQFNALVDFCYNLAHGTLTDGYLLKELNKGDYSTIANKFLEYNKAGGDFALGLHRRRLAEKRMWLGKDNWINYQVGKEIRE